MANFIQFFRFLEKERGKEIPPEGLLYANGAVTPEEVKRMSKSFATFNVIFEYVDITKLPAGLTFTDDAFFKYSKIEDLPENLTVGKNLHLTDSNIDVLPDSLTVGGKIFINSHRVPELQKRFPKFANKIFNEYDPDAY